MQATRPLTRTVKGSVKRSASRIPHLEYHILRKLNHHQKNKHGLQGQHQRARHQTTAFDPAAAFPTPWRSHLPDHADSDQVEDFLAAWDSKDVPKPPRRVDTPANVPAQDTPKPARRISFTANQLVQRIAVKNAEPVDLSQDISVAKLMEEGNPERLLSWLAYHYSGQTFVSVATGKEFEHVFCALDPEILVEPVKKALQHMRGTREYDAEISFQRSSVARLRRFAGIIDDVLARRQESGKALTLNTCRHALKWAASVGDLRIANHIWYTLMPKHDIQPDVGCYNAFMHAHNWNLGHSEISRVSYRNTERNLTLRSQKWRPRNLLGYSVSLNDVQPDHVLKSKILALFKEISQKGLIADEETFSNVMIGLARAGDVEAVNSILRSVWNVDIKALGTFDEEELESPTYYPEGHPLRPTDKLLWALVYCSVVNHSPSKAWTLLDYVSRNYALSIPEQVWSELFEWTYVMGLRRSQLQKGQGAAQGKINPKELENLYNTMTDEPHNVKPTPTMLNYLTRNYRTRRMLNKTLDTMRRAEKVLRQQYQKLKLMVETIDAISQDRRGLMDNSMLSAKFLEFRRDFLLLFLAVRQQHDFLVVETRRVLKERDFAGSGKYSTWSSQHLPQIVDEFMQYLPATLDYATASGHVSLKLKAHRDERLQEDEDRKVLVQATEIWHCLETSNTFQIMDDMQSLSSELERLRTANMDLGQDIQATTTAPFERGETITLRKEHERLIVGQHGKRVKAIEFYSGAQVTFVKSTGEYSRNSVCSISGTWSQVNKAKQMIANVVDEFDEREKSYAASKGGPTFRRINDV